jgi:hypothetical protein
MKYKKNIIILTFYSIICFVFIFAKNENTNNNLEKECYVSNNSLITILPTKIPTLNPIKENVISNNKYNNDINNNNIKNIIEEHKSKENIEKDKIETNIVKIEDLKITTSKNELYIENNDGIYNYCPTIIKEDNVFHTIYCSNENPYEVIDHIYYRKSIENENNFHFYDKIKILSPTPNEWDSIHVCDPSIIYGEYTYDNITYNYLMAYLGCNTLDNQQNKIGLAVSNSIETNWTKTKNINPIISIPYDNEHSDVFQWGVGQPSLINLDGKGMTLIFYTQGTYNITSQIVELWDLSNLNNPTKLWKTTLSNNGTNDFVSNADFVYENNILYMICDTHPFREGILSNVPNKTNVYKTHIKDFYDLNSFSNCFWEYVYSLDKISTSYEKNHNACFVRNKYGNYIGNYVAYSYAIEKEDFLNSLWTYRFKLKDF